MRCPEEMEPALPVVQAGERVVDAGWVADVAAWAALQPALEATASARPADTSRPIR